MIIYLYIKAYDLLFLHYLCDYAYTLTVVRSVPVHYSRNVCVMIYWASLIYSQSR